MLDIKGLHVEVDGKEILKGVTLSIRDGEVHALMGPNGSGKSTLSYAIMGHPKYKITKGDILLDGKSILNLPVNERAKLGLFLGFQYPQEIGGVGISNFMRTSLINTGKSAPNVVEFHNFLKEKMQNLGMPQEFLKRGLNVGFSGGEKKRSEILQLALLKPKFAILDEPDSGMDIDGLKVVGDNVEEITNHGTGILLITHHSRILDSLKPDFVHILVDGKVTRSAGPELAAEIEMQGYKEVAP